MADSTEPINRNVVNMENQIFITHYVNPHKFWYKPFHPGSKKKQQKQLQDALDEYCEQHYLHQVNSIPYEPIFGEVVVFYDPSLARWIRCSVSGLKYDAKGQQMCRLWLIDDGYPKVVGVELLRPLPASFQDKSTSSVQRGAIKNVFPARCVYDPQEDQVGREECSVWSENANHMVLSFIEGSRMICFESVTPYTIGKETINFGDLLFVTKGKTYNAVNLLSENAFGLIVDTKPFINQMLETETIIASGRSSMVNGKVSQNESSAYKAFVAQQSQPHAGMTVNGVNEREFDESVSMVGMQTPKNAQRDAIPRQQQQQQQPQQQQQEQQQASVSVDQSSPVVRKTGPSEASESSGSKRSLLLSQKLKLLKAKTMKNDSLNNSKERASSSVETGSVVSGQHSIDPFERIRKESYALTIDIGLSEKAEYELVHNTKPIEPSAGNDAEKLPKNDASKEESAVTKADRSKDVPPHLSMSNAVEKPQCVQKPKSVAAVTLPEPNETPAASQQITTHDTNDLEANAAIGSGISMKQKVALKFAKAKAQKSKQQEMESEQNKKPLPFAPAGVYQMPVMSKQSDLPTVQSNASLKKFDKVIQGEKCIFSRRTHYRVLVHGSKTPKPIDRIAAANFSPRVHQELEELGFTSLHRLQAYSWPHILRENSFICVNGASTGKTFAYLPAVCSVVQRQIEESLVTAVSGPVAIIITYTSREVQRIAFFCRKLLHSEAHSELAVLECYGIRDVTKVCNLLYNSCAILVTTAPGYRRLYERAPEAFVRKRIQTVVIDNIEEIWNHFGPELQLLCKNCDKEGLQMIVTAGYWIPVLAKFLQRYRNMVICIGAFLEAAVYAKARFSLLSFMGEERKQFELIRHLKEHDYRSERTIVFGNDVEDLVPIVEALRQNSINHIVGSERMVLQQHAGFSNWDELLPGDMVVLVCSDTVLGDLKISKAQHIIHYSLAMTWSTFTRRYACSFGYYDCPYLESKGQAAKGPATSLVLLNEKNNQQLPRLVDFLELHQEPIPDGLIAYAQKIRSMLEAARVAEGRAVSMLCTYILGFAVCRNVRNCVFRHTLTLSDMAPEDVPKSGKIRMKICHVFSPAHYAVRLEAHCPTGATGWTVLNDTKRYLMQDFAMQVHFANENRHQIHGQLRRNDLCAVFDDQNYWRCQIINHEEANGDHGEVQLLLIDTGRIMHTKSYALLHLPDQFRELPGQAINVRLAAIVPHDYEQDWDKSATNTVRRWIDNYASRPNCSIQGNVLLALKDTVWVDELYLVEELEGVKTTVTSERIRASLIAKQFGVGDKESFEKIRQLVRDCELFGMESLRREVEQMEREESGSGSGAGVDNVEDWIKGRFKPTVEVSFDSNETLNMVNIEVPLKYDQGLEISDEIDEKPKDNSGRVEPGMKMSEERDGALNDETANVINELFYAIQQQHITPAIRPADDDDEDEDEVSEDHMEMTPFAEEPPLEEDIPMAKVETDDTNLNHEITEAPAIEMIPVDEETPTEETEKDDQKLAPVESDNSVSSSSSFEMLTGSQAAERYQFDELLVGNSYNVIIGHYLAPDDFYVYQSDRIREVDVLIKKFTQDSSSLVPLKHPLAGQHCLALFEDFYYRGRIMAVPEKGATEVDVFLLDFGGIVRCSSVLKASDELLRAVPFLAIKGSFAHIKPTDGAAAWSEEVADAIYDRWLAQHNQGTLFAFIGQVLPCEDTERNEGCHRYEMLLCDGNTSNMLSLVSDIVYDGLAIWVRNEADDWTSTVPDTDEDDNFTQVNFTHEELADLMRKASAAGAIMDTTSARITELAPVESKEVQSAPPPTTTRPAIKSQETSGDERSTKRAIRTQKRTLRELRLECDYCFPPTVWDQEKYFVVLRVHAPDVQRYNLILTTTSVLLQFVKEDDATQRYVLALTLRNPIVPRDSVHGIRGLSIVLRLRKLVPGKRWPTVDTIGSKKLRWVQFANGDDSSSDEMVKENRWKDMLRAHLDSSSVTSSSSGVEQEVDSDVEDEEGVFLALS
uniref:RNA helicase n=1 Tax=Anopheles epiroticus TaxID=199890 RepID=A0A182PLB1_9DIPT